MISGSFFTTGKLAGLGVYMYNTHFLFDRGKKGQNCAYYSRDFTAAVFN